MLIIVHITPKRAHCGCGGVWGALCCTDSGQITAPTVCVLAFFCDSFPTYTSISPYNYSYLLTP